jgi:Na+/phosphate symporter
MLWCLIKHRENSVFTVIINIFDTLLCLFVTTLLDLCSLVAIKTLSKSMCSIQHLSKGISHTEEAVIHGLKSENILLHQKMLEMLS